MTKSRLIDRVPVVHQLRQSVGLQRGMLVAGLVLTNYSAACIFGNRSAAATPSITASFFLGGTEA